MLTRSKRSNYHKYKEYLIGRHYEGGLYAWSNLALIVLLPKTTINSGSSDNDRLKWVHQSEEITGEG